MEMVENIAEVKKAKEQIVQGSLIIWSARLETLIRSGDVRRVVEHLRSPVEWGDNCGCGNAGCGLAPEFLDLVSEYAKRTSK